MAVIAWRLALWRFGRWVTRPFTLPLLALTFTVLLPATVLLVTVWLSGWKLQVVQTNSMWPTYPTGTLLVTESVTPSQVRAGDPLVFHAPWKNRQLVTHRVRLILEDDDGSLRFVTRGDASDADDPSPVPARETFGIVKWGIPSLGSFVWAIRGARGVVALVVLPAVALVLTELRDRRRRNRSVCPTCGRGVHSTGAAAERPPKPVSSRRPAWATLSVAPRAEH